MTDYYRVVEDDPADGCKHCGHGKMFTIVSGTGDDEIGIGQAWGDEDFTGDICDHMNMAFEAGTESVLGKLERIVEIINAVESRCMAVDGPVTNTRHEMTDDELRRIYVLAGGKVNS